MGRLSRLALCLGLAFALACSSPDPAGSPAGDGKADDRGQEIGGDVASTRLEVDVSKRRGKATIAIAPTARTISLEAAGLTIHGVTGAGGAALPHRVEAGRLEVDLPSLAAQQIAVDYSFEVQSEFNGLLKNGSTNVWPYHCGNLYPCDSRPSDGLTFELAVTGVPAGQTAVFPDSIAADAPPYTLAWAVGSYTCQDLGATPAGTAAKVCWLPKGKTKALAGTKDLVAVFDWLETHIGAYTFGDQVGSVSVAWGEGAAGGMEHHPLWHISRDEMGDPLVHAHEATHGWYGTGVRIACWEQFVLSEGTTSYVSARALGAVAGQEVEDQIWADYKQLLLDTLAEEDILAWPEGCGAVDILEDGLFSDIVYMKGAFFYRAVAEQIGADKLDEVLAAFYRDHVGKAARMETMLEYIQDVGGFDPTALAELWLRSKGNPFK